MFYNFIYNWFKAEKLSELHSSRLVPMFDTVKESRLDKKIRMCSSDIFSVNLFFN